jgi:hypothetical protein
MTARTDLASSIESCEKQIDALFAPLAPQVAASVRNRAEGGKITHAARRAILRDLDALLDTVYPTKRGAPSRLENLIVRQTAAVRRKPVAAAVETIETKLDDELVLKEMMRRGTRR